MPPIRWSDDAWTRQKIRAFVGSELLAMGASPQRPRKRDKHIESPQPTTSPSEQEKRYQAADRAILERLRGNLNNPLDLAYDTRIDFLTVAGDMTRNLPHTEATETERLELVRALRWRWNKYVKIFEEKYIKPPRTDGA